MPAPRRPSHPKEPPTIDALLRPSPSRSLPRDVRARGVTAVLGPTNTGKTHLAIERMLAHPTGMIGLPLRLLAREVYLRVVAKVGPEKVALVTGEEKIKPDRPRYWICTIEAMPRDLDVAFVAIDEIQLAADMDRGHVFTDRLLYVRGREETLLIGSSTVLPLVQSLIPNVHTTTRPRLSQLSFAGEKRLSRLPRRTAIVAFSAEEVYAIAELIRRQRGGAAVVLGALSPRTRNAQVEMYQAGDVDYLVATDAVGMGLNLDVDHVAFAANWKYDGTRFRKLTPAEMGQIAGRAGRHLADGTFGSTGRCPPFEPELVERLESHDFDPLRILQWRNPDLAFGSLEALQASLDEHPRESGLTRAPMGEDQQALEILMKEDDIRDMARERRHGPEAVGRLRRAGLPQGPPAGARRPGGPALSVPHEGDGRPHPRHVVRRAGGDDRPHRRRHRHPVPTDRAGAHLDLRGKPSRLAARPRTLAGRDASGRGQAVRRPARTPREPLRRPAHKRPDAAPEREHDARSPDYHRR